MIGRDDISKQNGESRRQVEEAALKKITQSPDDLHAMSSEETRRILSELQTHQVELEMQNEELRSKQVELDNTRAEFFDFYDLAPVGYCTIGSTGQVLMANLTAAKLLCVVREKLVGQTIFTFIHKEDQDNYYLFHKSLLKTSETKSCELRMVKSDGTTFWAQLVATATPNSSSIPVQESFGVGVCRIVLSDISALKETEERLRESEQNFSSLMNSGLALIWTSGKDRRCNYFNRAWLEFTGRTLDQELGNGWAEGVHPDDLKGCLDISIAAFERQKTFSKEYRLRRHDGTYRWIVDEGCPRYDSRGEFIGYIGHCLDIDERKRVERFLKDVITKNPMSIQILDKDGLTLEINPAYRSLFGSVPPSGYSIFNDSQLLQMGMGTLFDQLRNGEIVRFPDTYFNAHDSIAEFPDVPAWIRTVGFPLNDSNEKPERFVLMHENITKGKQAEKALRESEETFRNIVEASPMGIHLYQLQNDDHLVFIGTNPAADKLLGVDNTKFIGMTIEEAFPPLQYTEIPSRYRRAAQLGESWHTEAIDYDHDKIAGAFDVYAFQMSLGKVAVLFNDITERKQAEKERERLQMQLTQAQKMEAVGQLAGGVAHDFNNMLGVILGYSELILAQVGPSQPFHAELAEIEKAARRSADLTRQLLTFARKQTVALRVLDLNQTIEGMLNMLRRLIGENINLIWMPGNGLWPIKMDPSQIDQILANLCVNARDAITGVGKITVETENTPLSEKYCATHAGFIPGEYVRIAVSDCGNGMDAETLAHIFEPFFTTKGVGEGTGLGLATVYGAVRQNNGFINASSEPGRGTTFTIYIPRYTDKVVPAAVIVAAEPIATGTETILLVEDEPMILTMTTQMLVGQGYHVLTAASPWEAISLAKEHAGSIDLLMTDVIMPEMNGRDLAKHLFTISPNIKCLFMSGYTASVIEPHGVLGEGLHFIQKPFNMKDLATAIREALES